MRLDRYLTACTAFSRRDVRSLVREHAVTVDGFPAESPDVRVEESSEVCVRGQKIRYREFVYLMLNKPAGWLSATEDAKDPVVVDLVPEELRHFAPFPVGRLDKDTEGLLILSNDGAFNHAVTSPAKNVYKRYFARLDRPAEPADAELFGRGMVFKDFTAKPAKLEFTENPLEIYLEIAEGKFHQVKRMCERAGKSVVYLKRVAVGPLKLDESLAPGEMRELTDAELGLLYK